MFPISHTAPKAKVPIRADEVTASVRVNLSAMRMWALQYALHIKVLKPEKLAKEMKEDLRKASELYNEHGNHTGQYL